MLNSLPLIILISWISQRLVDLGSLTVQNIVIQWNDSVKYVWGRMSIKRDFQAMTFLSQYSSSVHFHNNGSKLSKFFSLKYAWLSQGQK